MIRFRITGWQPALAWEAATRLIGPAGVPVFDVVRTLGTLAFRPDEPAGWWPLGVGAHVLVGVCWAVFYAYFFWSVLARPPALQGLVFALAPAALAILIVAPQLALMQVAPGNAASVRAFLAAGYEPAGGEALLLARVSPGG